MKPKLNQSLKVLSIFVAGLAVGSLIMGYLSVRASKTFVEVLRSNYNAEQESLAADAHSKGNKYAEFIHRRNIVESSRLGNLTVFNKMKTAWSFDFPFSAIALSQFIEQPGIEKGRKIVYAIDLGRLAEATENIGLKEEADKMWNESAKNMGYDVPRLRSFIASLHKIDENYKSGTCK